MDRTESHVGSKGELFPSKEIREKLGLKPYTRVIYSVEDGKLIVEPVPSVEDMIDQPPEIEITQDELDADRRELSRRLER
jgi:bifunctional DNA-binding transcriptional regulator/antitoxin component of YhaV-PrlF toxin-antitoxin module